MRRSLLPFSAILLALLTGAPAQAGSLTLRLSGADGKPAPDVVVALKPVGSAAPLPKAQGPYEIRQRDTRFQPFISVVPVDASVSFPNFDPFRHHVYSFSPAKRFELKLFARDQTRSVVFDQAGVVAVGCNIHDSMSAFIFVTDSAWTARTDAKGVAVLRDLPGGALTLTVWHPYLAAPGGLMTQAIAGDAGDRTQALSIRLRPPPMHPMGSY